MRRGGGYRSPGPRAASFRSGLLRKALVGLFVAAMALPALTVDTLWASTAAAQDSIALSEAEARMLEVAARNRRLKTSDLEVLTSSTMKLRLTGVTAPVAKLRRRDTGAIFSMALDEDGKEVNPQDLRANESLARRARYGKLDPYLYDRVEKMAGADLVKVALWLKLKQDLDAKDPRTGDEKRLSEEQIDQMIVARNQLLRKAAAEASKPVRSFLSKKRLQLDSVSLMAPLVYATVPVRTLKALSLREDVLRIYAADTAYEPHLEAAAKSIRADKVWETFYPVNGSGVNVAVVEGGRVDFDNTCFGPNIGSLDPDDSEDDFFNSHATAVAGIINSNNGWQTGIAPGARIFSANAGDFKFANLELAFNEGSQVAHILNNSWGKADENTDDQPDIWDVLMDYTVRYAWDTVVCSAGNSGSVEGREWVDSPASAYNVIAVGIYDDRGTPGTGDDMMNPMSSYKDPDSPHGDREKPEVAAPGTNIDSLLTTSGGCDTGIFGSGSGTSYAAPMVSGLAALLIDLRGELKVWPEAVKALVMAGATNNIEGDSRLSDKDGAGGVDAMSAVSSANANQFRTMMVSLDSFNEDHYIEINIGSVSPLTRLRVALTWDSNPQNSTASDWTDSLDTDLDLFVVGPAGIGRSSISFDNNYEVVDFVVPLSVGTGDFKIRIYDTRFRPEGTEYVGVAWTMTPTINPIEVAGSH